MAAFTGSETTEVCSAPSGAPALAAASLADSWEVVKLLIEQGVDVKSDAGGAALIRDHSQPRASAGNGRRENGRGLSGMYHQPQLVHDPCTGQTTETIDNEWFSS